MVLKRLNNLSGIRKMAIVFHRTLNQIALVVWEGEHLEYSSLVMGRIDGSSLVYNLRPSVIVGLVIVAAEFVLVDSIHRPILGDWILKVRSTS